MVMTCRERLEAYLREQQVPFEVHHHPPSYTAQATAATEHISGKLLAKVVMVLADDRMVLLALPAPDRVNLTAVGALLGAQEVRLAQENEFARNFPDCEVGAMPPFGNLYGVPVYVESALAENETLVIQAGTHTDTLRMHYADFERLVQPTVAAFAHRRAGVA
jgi:Ala-tRNA(Pro) deacylase